MKVTNLHTLLYQSVPTGMILEGGGLVLGTGFEPMKSCDARFTVATI